MRSLLFVEIHRAAIALLQSWCLLQVIEILTQELLDLIDNTRGGLLGEYHSWVQKLSDSAECLVSEA